MDKNKAIILAVAAGGLPFENNGPNGDETWHMMTGNEKAIVTLLEVAGTWLGPRGVLEQDERFRQIIPYVVVKVGDKFVTYVRGAAGGEARLHGKMSIGLGGHIDLPDVKVRGDEPRVNIRDTLFSAAERELAEEVTISVNGITSPSLKYGYDPVRWVGLLADNTDAVGRVHLGVVGVLQLPETYTVTSNEPAQTNIEYLTRDELLAQSDRLEGWTRIALSKL